MLLVIIVNEAGASRQIALMQLEGLRNSTPAAAHAGRRNVGMRVSWGQRRPTGTGTGTTRRVVEVSCLSACRFPENGHEEDLEKRATTRTADIVRGDNIMHRCAGFDGRTRSDPRRYGARPVRLQR